MRCGSSRRGDDDRWLTEVSENSNLTGFLRFVESSGRPTVGLGHQVREPIDNPRGRLHASFRSSQALQLSHVAVRRAAFGTSIKRRSGGKVAFDTRRSLTLDLRSRHHTVPASAVYAVHPARARCSDTISRSGPFPAPSVPPRDRGERTDASRMERGRRWRTVRDTRRQAVASAPRHHLRFRRAV